MSVDESLAARVRAALARKRSIEEKKMFGGICFLLNGNMLVGVWKSFLIVRLGPDQVDQALQRPFVKKMDITGRPMNGWVMVDAEGVPEIDDIKEWILLANKFVAKLPAK